MADTPNVRFKGFQDAWEWRKLGEIVDVCSGRDYKHVSEGDVPVYGTGGYMLSISEALSEEDDAIGIGRKGTINNPYILRAPFWTVDTLFYCIPKKDYNLDFVFCVYQNIDWKAKEESTGVPSLSRTIINNIDIITPLKTEQERIGNYFADLDHLITLYQRKCDETKELKKYMLQKMFPRDGKKTPEIRFAGFTDDWEPCKFGDGNDLLTGYPFESEKFVEDGIKLVRGMNVKRGYLDFSEEICMKWNSSDGLENYLLKDGDILIQMDGALIGQSYAKIKEDQLPALLVQRVTRVRTKKGIADSDFMYQTIQRDFLAYIGMNKTETAVPHLSLNDIKNFTIMAPAIEEQRKLGTYFANLDNLITLQQCKCDALKEVKKYMLQNMFPQKG